MLAHLSWLRALVTALTVTMIAGFAVLIWALVSWLNASDLPLSHAIRDLPRGVTVESFAGAQDWYAVLTSDGRVLVFDRATDQLYAEHLIGDLYPDGVPQSAAD